MAAYNLKRPFAISTKSMGAVFRAATGIGSNNDIDTAVSTVAASNTSSGNIEIDNRVGGLLTLGMVGGLSGVTNTAPGGTIVITNASPITVSETIDSNGGNVTLDATTDVDINASILSGGGAVCTRCGHRRSRNGQDGDLGERREGQEIRHALSEDHMRSTPPLAAKQLASSRVREHSAFRCAAGGEHGFLR